MEEERSPIIRSSESSSLRQIDSDNNRLAMRQAELDIREKELEIQEKELRLQVAREQTSQAISQKNREHLLSLAVTIITLLSGIWFASLNQDIGYYLLGAGGASGILTSQTSKQSRKTDKSK